METCRAEQVRQQEKMEIEVVGSSKERKGAVSGTDGQEVALQ